MWYHLQYSLSSLVGGVKALTSRASSYVKQTLQSISDDPPYFLIPFTLGFLVGSVLTLILIALITTP